MTVTILAIIAYFVFATLIGRGTYALLREDKEARLPVAILGFVLAPVFFIGMLVSVLVSFGQR